MYFVSSVWYIYGTFLGYNGKSNKKERVEMETNIKEDFDISFFFIFSTPIPGTYRIIPLSCSNHLYFIPGVSLWI
jgi:hypothetical protein